MIVGMAGETTSCSIAVTIIATMSATVTLRRPAIEGAVAVVFLPTVLPVSTDSCHACNSISGPPSPPEHGSF